MCEYCKIYTDEEIDKIKESGKEYDIIRIEAGITTLSNENIDFGVLGIYPNWVYLQVSKEEGNKIVSQICLDGKFVPTTEIKINFCPMCGRNLTEE